MSIAPCLSSERMDWQTPDAVLDLVRKVAPIGLDPCTTADNPCGAERFYCRPEHDGLADPWNGMGLVYLNPPYGREISQWTRTAALWAAQGVEIVMLTGAKPDTQWWHGDIVPGAAGVLFWKGRLRFRGAPAAAPFPSALVYYGERLDRFTRACDGHGWLVYP